MQPRSDHWSSELVTPSHDEERHSPVESGRRERGRAALVQEPARRHGVGADQHAVGLREGDRHTGVGEELDVETGLRELERQATSLEPWSALRARDDERCLGREGGETCDDGSASRPGRQPQGRLPARWRGQQIGGDPREHRWRAPDPRLESCQSVFALGSDSGAGGVPDRCHGRLGGADGSRDLEHASVTRVAGRPQDIDGATCERRRPRFVIARQQLDRAIHMIQGFRRFGHLINSPGRGHSCGNSS